MGCYFHGCKACYPDRNVVNAINGKSMEELGTSTENITSYLRDTVGVIVIEQWECDWKKEKQQNPPLARFLQARFPPYVSPFKGPINVSSILDAVNDKNVIRVGPMRYRSPRHLRDYFYEMPPIFKNVEVTKDDVGKYIKHTRTI